jgi:hypothetical protein
VNKVGLKRVIGVKALQQEERMLKHNIRQTENIFLAHAVA